MPLGTSNHSLVYLIRKTHYTIPGFVKIIQWDDISLLSHPYEMWQFWKNQFLTCIDKHAPHEIEKNWKQEVPVDYIWVYT